MQRDDSPERIGHCRGEPSVCEWCFNMCMNGEWSVQCGGVIMHMGCGV